MAGRGELKEMAREGRCRVAGRGEVKEAVAARTLRAFPTRHDKG